MHIRVAAKLFNRHKKPSDRVIATNNIKMPESLRKQVEQNNEVKNDYQTVMLHTVYGMVKEEIPDSKFNFLMNLQRKDGVPCLQNEARVYKHHDNVFEMQKAMS
jgi:hypothetical protein